MNEIEKKKTGIINVNIRMNDITNTDSNLIECSMLRKVFRQQLSHLFVNRLITQKSFQ